MLLWLCFTALGDWLKKIEKTRGSSPTNQIQNKNQLTLGTHEWTRLALVTCVPSSSSCVIVLRPFVVTGHCDCFGFGFTVLRGQRYRPVMGTFSACRSCPFAKISTQVRMIDMMFQVKFPFGVFRPVS